MSSGFLWCCLQQKLTKIVRYNRDFNHSYVPATNCCYTICFGHDIGRTILGPSGVQNKLFPVFLFSEHDVGVQFLTNVGLIPISMMCRRCGSQMSWCVDKSVKDHYQWRCLKSISATAWLASISIRQATWLV